MTACGADIELDDSREFGFCNYCGTKVMQDKIVVEHKGSVTIDSSDELKNLYLLAQRAKDNNDSKSAQKYYEQIVLKDPSSWEAQFYSVYYRCAQCKIGEIENASIILANCLGNVLDLIKETVSGDVAQATAAVEVTSMCVKLFTPFVNGIWSLYQPNGHYNNPKYFEAKVENVLIIYSTLARETKARFDSDNPVFKRLIDETDSIESRVRETSEKRTQSEAKRRSGCYVATAVYGSYDCPQVWTLRRYRDNELAKTWYGRAFIRTYYAISPTIVKWFGETEWFKNMWRGKLDKMVDNLNANGVDNTPYNDIEW